MSFAHAEPPALSGGPAGRMPIWPRLFPYWLNLPAILILLGPSPTRSCWHSGSACMA